MANMKRLRLVPVVFAGRMIVSPFQQGQIAAVRFHAIDMACLVQGPAVDFVAPVGLDRELLLGGREPFGGNCSIGHSRRYIASIWLV